MRKGAQAAAAWIGGIVLLLGMPLAGVWLAGASVTPYLQMPPRAAFVPHEPFSWAAFCGLGLLVGAATWPLARRVARGWLRHRRSDAPVSGFPWWGWAALVSGCGFWVLAWTRFSWFQPLQHHTFTPLWLAYIAAMNALAFRQTGRSPLTHRTGLFLGLFPLSALFWWLFEYLNRFVGNWHYAGAEALGAGEYVARATLSFSVVLPAFVATRAWLAGRPSMWRELAGWKPVVVARPRLLAGTALAVAALGLAGIGIRPELLFPLVWIAPLAVVASIRALAGQRTLLNDPGQGDWRRIAMSAAASVICGFFWELWNYHSLDKWIYSVPFVDRFHLFEMPMLGYAGYLPFGIECALAAELIGMTGGEAVETGSRD